MRRNNLLYLLIGLTALSCSSAPEVTLQVTNPLHQERSDAIILLSRDEISRLLDIPLDQIPVLTDLRGNYIPCQVDDVDGDGIWDELFGMSNLDSSGQQKIVIQFISPDNYPVFPVRTNVHLGDAGNKYSKLLNARRLEGVSYHNYTGRTSAAYQMEGPAWENDKVGFRNYLDQRNGMDIFGKTSSRMVLDSVGTINENSYHESGDWGMDVLKVGTSLGAGGIGYMYRDSIYRLGDNGSGTFDLVFQGPLRSRFMLTYSNWMVEDLSVDVSHQVEIIAGRHYYQSIVTYSGSEVPLALVPGIVNMKSQILYKAKLNDQYSALFTFDKQSEDSTLLAMALMVPSTYLRSAGETRNEGEGIIQSYYAVLNTSEGKPIPYRFYALWEKEDPRWGSLEEIQNYLKSEADRWTRSVVVAN